MTGKRVLARRRYAGRMGRELAIVIVIGLALGALVPLREGATDPAPAPEPDKPTASTTPAPAAPTGSWGGQPRQTVLQRDATGHFYATATVNGQPVRMVIDTGASTIALTIDDARRIGIPVNPAAFTVIGTGAGGPLRGQQVLLDRVELDGKEVRGLSGAILEGLEVSLLGQSYLSRIGSVQMNGDTMTLR